MMFSLLLNHPLSFNFTKSASSSAFHMIFLLPLMIFSISIHHPPSSSCLLVPSASCIIEEEHGGSGICWQRNLLVSKLDLVWTWPAKKEDQSKWRTIAAALCLILRPQNIAWASMAGRRHMTYCCLDQFRIIVHILKDINELSFDSS